MYLYDEDIYNCIQCDFMSKSKKAKENRLKKYLYIFVPRNIPGSYDEYCVGIIAQDMEEASIIGTSTIYTEFVYDFDMENNIPIFHWSGDEYTFSKDITDYFVIYRTEVDGSRESEVVFDY